MKLENRFNPCQELCRSDQSKSGGLRVAYGTYVGRERRSNEDALFVDPDTGLLVVADGMGGHNAGDVASLIAVREISESIRNGFQEEHDVAALIRNSILAAHHRIAQRSYQDPDLRDMGTTVVLALFREHSLWIAHVGDSRAYLIDDKDIRCLTRDHTLTAEWLEEGIISSEQARTHVARHALTMALGVDDDVEPVVTVSPWKQQERLLLCSDGLTDILDDEELLETLQSIGEPQEGCKRLAERAFDKGAPDDVSVIVACR
jgi:serine/threonine protein phosphatase PrpC